MIRGKPNLLGENPYQDTVIDDKSEKRKKNLCILPCSPTRERSSLDAVMGQQVKLVPRLVAIS